MSILRRIRIRQYRFLRWILKKWAISSKSHYVVEIVKFYFDGRQQELMIDYRIKYKRIESSISLNHFIDSPLIYGVHPKQMYLLGIEQGRTISTKERIDCHSEKAADTLSQPRLRKIFYHEKTVQS